MNRILRQYDVIEITRIIKKRKSSLGDGEPRVGDVATVVEVYREPSLGFDLECCDEHGLTKWLAIFEPEDFEFNLRDG